MADTKSIPSVPPPWTLKATLWVLPFFTSASQPLPHDKAFAPLESASPVWIDEAQTGKFKGGLAIAQILRYTDTPVGPYDELVVTPGYYEGPKSVPCKGKHLRITGIWVSQETTCMNGRKNWNIPKHLARFAFTELKPGSKYPLKVEVFPHDKASSRPMFSTVIHAASYSPTFPFSSTWQDYLGFSTKMLQPPLPTGKPPHMEVGTEEWMRLSPVLGSNKTKFVWMDMEQSRSEGEASGAKRADNWWPGMGKWRLGLAAEDTTVHLGHPDIFKSS